MRYKVTIVAFVEAESYSRAVEIADLRLVGHLRSHGGSGPIIEKVKPVRIDARLEGETK